MLRLQGEERVAASFMLKALPCDVSDEPGLAADGLPVPNPAVSVAVARGAWTAVWNVGRVAAKVEVTSSHSFLFIFLFPEFHCYYSNKRWFKLSPLCFYPGTLTVPDVSETLILETSKSEPRCTNAPAVLGFPFFFLLISHFTP